MLEIVKSDLK